MTTLEAAYRDWVAPFYLKLLHGNFKGVCTAPEPHKELVRFALALPDALSKLTPEVVDFLFAQKDWRARLVASWYAGLKGWDQYRQIIGHSLRQSKVCYAGQGYSIALACFSTHQDAAYLSEYLEEYLFQQSKFYDQHWAMPALIRVDKTLGTSYSERFLRRDGLWHFWEKGSSGRSLDKYLTHFTETLRCAQRLQAGAKPGPDIEQVLRGAGPATAATPEQRIFGCACCRRIWPLLSEPSRRAVEVREGFEQGKATEADCESARLQAEIARRAARDNSTDHPAAWAAGAALNACRGLWFVAAELAARAVADGDAHKYNEERAAQYKLYMASCP